MPRPRRRLLLALPLLWLGRAAAEQSSPLDSVAVYLIPLSDFPENLAAALARSLQDGLGLRIKASLRLPPLAVDKLPGTNQLVSESLLAAGLKASAGLPEAAPGTYRVFLTTQDINSRSANFRFQFSSHDKNSNSSVISLARLLEYVEERPTLTDRSVLRLVKMTMRAIGEMKLGWQRSPDPNDLMYSPLMGLDDLDRVGLDHAEPGHAPAPPPRRSPNSV